MTVTNQNQLYIIISVSRSPLVLIESSGCTVMQLCSWHISAVHKSWHGPMIAFSDDCDLLPSFWPVLVMRAEELMWWIDSTRLFLCAAIVSIHTGCCHAKVRVPRSPWSAACQQTYGVIFYPSTGWALGICDGVYAVAGHIIIWYQYVHAKQYRAGHPRNILIEWITMTDCLWSILFCRVYRCSVYRWWSSIKH